MKNLFIDILAFGALLSSVLVITSKNPVIAVIFLISTFVNAAGYLILSGLGFIGLSYILVYIGAIAVLFLFVIMLINIRLAEVTETGKQYTKNIPLAVVISLIFIYEFFTIMPFTFNNVSVLSYLLNIVNNLNSLILTSNADISSSNIIYSTINPILADGSFTSFTQIQALGLNLYTFGSIWLIITSVILLLAMIAPIFVSKSGVNNSNINPISNLNNNLKTTVKVGSDTSNIINR